VSDARISIFPLSSVVLFPGVQTPLHLFEPRYRQMVDDVLAAERRIGMVLVPPEHTASMPGDPPVYPIGCAGTISQDQRLPDGRYNIVLLGERRFRIVSEPARPAERLYRVAEVAWLDDPLPAEAEPRVNELRRRIEAQVCSLVKREDPERAAGLADGILAGVDAPTFVNTLSNALAFSAPEKQGLLEAQDIPQRFERLEGLLAFRLAESPLSKSGSGRPN
jgi:Lon protease-like protein